MVKSTGSFSDPNWLSSLSRPKGSLLWIPGMGIVVFLVLYVIAALLYPGGSAVYPGHTGFDIRYNYLCDLLDEYALNGSLNTARSYARIGLFLLCSGLLLLWFYLPKLFDNKTANHFVMWICGILSLLIIFFMASKNHDLIVRLAGAFGVVAIITCSYALLRAQYFKSGWLGFTCLIVFLVNYYIYETGIHIRALPVIQKVTFLLCLTWLMGLNQLLYSKINGVDKKHRDAKI
jgi:hypothetical protein